MKQTNLNQKQQLNKIKAKETQFNPSAIKKMFAKEFSGNTENFRWSPNEKILARYSRYGFLNVISGGFDSSGTNALEVVFPENFDLAIEQKNGFAIFFWFLAKKQPNNVMRYIVKKGNSIDELTPCVGFLPNNTNLFAKIVTSRQKIESMISNKKIESGRIYSVALSIDINHNEDITEISLYIDGGLDSQISIPGEPMHNQGSVWLGKPDSTSHGFVGTLSDVMLIPRYLTEEEINEINNNGIQNLLKTNGEMFNTSDIFEKKFERTVLMEKYLTYTQSSPYIVDNLQLSNKELKEIVKQYDEEERKADPPIEEVREDPSEQRMIKRIEEMFQNFDEFVIVKKIYLNSRFINTVLFLTNKGEDVIEFKRIIDIFEILSENLLFNFDLKFIKALAKNLNSVCPDDKSSMVISIFFKNLKQIHDMYFPDEILNTYSQIDENEKSPMELHENTLLGSNFKNVFDNDEGENINYRDSFAIKSFYNPKVKLNEQKEDIVNQEEAEDENEGIEEEEEEEKYDVPQLTEEQKTALKFVDSIFDNASHKENDLFMTGTKMEQNSNYPINQGSKDFDKKAINDSKEKKKGTIDPSPDKKSKQSEETEEQQKHEYDPEFPQDWNEGTFELVINHCYDCHKHSKTTRHYEYTFVDKFNELSDSVKAVFPNVYIVGNYDDLEYYGSFNVFLRGLGPVFDHLNRYFLFKKSKMGRFPTNTEINDKLIALSMVYGSSQNMESAQMQFLKQNPQTKKSLKFHDYPATLSDEAEKVKNKLLEDRKEPPKIDEHTKFWCINWGCGKVYMNLENRKGCCQYHPGVWQFASYNGYWPECWSCCELEWESSGCTIGLHKGVRIEERTVLCLNHGEVNPQTKHPDSACGNYFNLKKENRILKRNKEEKEEICQYHSGYLENGSFTCCNSDIDSKGCVTRTHETVEFPDPKAKLYFYPKPVKNPGVMVNPKQQSCISVGKLICKCDYFKNIKVVYENIKTKNALLQMKRKKEAEEPRYCMNWACEQVYYEKENEKSSCCCHPGRWDHGCTGTKLETYYKELHNIETKQKKTILWIPHWTCCHKDWNEPGCKLIKHKGPLISSLGDKPVKYKWPSIRLKLIFTKVITDNWRRTLYQYTYDEYKVRTICKKFFKERVSNYFYNKIIEST